MDEEPDFYTQKGYQMRSPPNAAGAGRIRAARRAAAPRRREEPAAAQG